MAVSDCSRAQFPGGGCCCCLIKVELFHRQSEVCEGASERPDERTDFSREKLLLFFFFFFGSSVQDPHHACMPHRHLVSHYSQNLFLAECQWHVSSSPPSCLLPSSLLQMSANLCIFTKRRSTAIFLSNLSIYVLPLSLT